jgi:hypothetical protein
MVGQVVFSVARVAPLADEPRGLAGQVLPARVLRPIRDDDAHGGEARRERALRPVRHVSRRQRAAASTCSAGVLATEGSGAAAGGRAGVGAASACHVGRVDLLDARDAHRPR